MESKIVTILMSGGIDSTACVHYYKRLDYNIKGVFVDYGQRSKPKEYYSVKKVAQHFHIPLKRISIRGLDYMPGGLVNGRNLFLLSTVLLKYKYQGLIALGIHDGTNYKDCQFSFIESVQKVVDIYYNGSVILDAPFHNFTKNEIWNYCLKNKIPVELTYSCELGKIQPCGKCDSCKDLISLYESSKQYN
jgi:7-cyano-7-deazaguanine synthase